MDKATRRKVEKAARRAANAAAGARALLAGTEPGLLPWRHDPDPYKVFLAEFLLRKTTYKQAAAVYGILLEKYPRPCVLAAAKEQELGRMLRPLGIRRRVRQMLAAARAVCEKHGGVVPCDRKELESLPGAGPYLAGAVLSFGCGEREPLVDTGIARLWGRVVPGAVTRTYSPHRDPAAWLASRAYIESYPGPPEEGNYLLLDTARAVCLPKQPECEQCPFRSACASAVARIG